MIYTLEECKYDGMWMWSWLAKNPGQSKIDFLNSHHPYPRDAQGVQIQCSLCEYDDQYGGQCCKCPVDWSSEQNECGEKGGECGKKGGEWYNYRSVKYLLITGNITLDEFLFEREYWALIILWKIKGIKV